MRKTKTRLTYERQLVLDTLRELPTWKGILRALVLHSHPLTVLELQELTGSTSITVYRALWALERKSLIRSTNRNSVSPGTPLLFEVTAPGRSAAQNSGRLMPRSSPSARTSSSMRASRASSTRANSGKSRKS